jgi:signal transduction histidine kinase
MLRLYALTVVALLVVYFLIALALEIFVLPKNVWRPIARLREADAAVQEGRRDVELIHDSEMPGDELGEIMRSRNDSIRKLREHEDALARALDQLELVANDLKRKNHLLESVQRNMADQDRLVSLGMMSAGLAHEMNTPLAVLKGAVEQIAEKPDAGVDAARAHLLLRTVHRLERLSENLLDFARVRPHSVAPVALHSVIEDSWELVRLDREVGRVSLANELDEDLTIEGDADRLSQVFVNILRNAADAMDGEGGVRVRAERSTREGAEWVSIHIKDSGPGVDPEILPRLFEPFTTTRLDARGTGLGLAVAEGIVREHGGVILANNTPEGGADFEIMLPVKPPAPLEPPELTA